MKDFEKVNGEQLFSYWKKLSVGLLALIAMMTISRVLPDYCAPIVAVLTAAFFYTYIYAEQFQGPKDCNLTTYALFRCIINYTLVVIVLNLLMIWHLLPSTPELYFLEPPFIPSLILHPVCFITLLYLYIRRKHLSVCRDCKIQNGGFYERGRIARIFRYESYFQLRNLLFVFGVLTVLVWTYYKFIFLPFSISARDWYIFMWLTVIVFVIDEIYFVYRYYNLYLDLKDSDSLISPDELNDMTAKTYLRFYVCCGDKVYVDPHSLDASENFREVIDTPFVTKHSVNGISASDVRGIIEQKTDIRGGELKFFYGRRSTDSYGRSMLRYFYFIDEDTCQDKELSSPGEWIDFETLKRIYSRTPGKLSAMFVGDISRLATIILTSKIFDEEGRRKNKIKSYTPSFDLMDVRTSNLDFQDEKWIQVSMFNSDSRFFKIRKWWRGLRNRRQTRRSL